MYDAQTEEQYQYCLTIPREVYSDREKAAKIIEVMNGNLDKIKQAVELAGLSQNVFNHFAGQEPEIMVAIDGELGSYFVDQRKAVMNNGLAYKLNEFGFQSIPNQNEHEYELPF